MSSTSWPVYSPFACEHFGKGEAKGRAEGRAEGEAKGRADAVLKILAARGVEVPEEAGARIHACTDIRQLDTWLDRALKATTVTDLFD